MKIQAKNLKKIYDQNTALNLDELAIESGEVFGLVGNNGAGKTTFLRLVLDLIEATDGFLLSNDLDVAKSKKWKEYTGSYLDESFIFDFLKPEEFFEFVGVTYNMSEQQVEEELKNFNKFFNDEILNKKKYIRELSKGNIQKVGIAAAMLPNPKVLVLDEPYSHLDPRSQIILKKMIKNLSDCHNSTILISSHNLTFVTDICERIVLIEKGKIIKDIKSNENSLKELEEYFSINI